MYQVNVEVNGKTYSARFYIQHDMFRCYTQENYVETRDAMVEAFPILMPLFHMVNRKIDGTMMFDIDMLMDMFGLDKNGNVVEPFCGYNDFAIITGMNKDEYDRIIKKMFNVLAPCERKNYILDVLLTAHTPYLATTIAIYNRNEVVHLIRTGE